MNLDKQNTKKILWIIVFIAAVSLTVINFKEVLKSAGILITIFKPFIWGAALAFVMNIPMSAIERGLFGKWKGKAADSLKRPASIVLSGVLVVGILLFVIMTVVPQLGKTIMELGNKLPAFIDSVLVWLEEIFASNPQFVSWLNELQAEQFNWQEVVSGIIGFLRNGIGNMLSSTVNMAGTIIGGVVNVFVAIIFSIYVLSQKEALGNQGRRILKAYTPQKVNDKVSYVLSLLSANFSSFISGQCLEAVILGTMFVVTLTIFRIPYALLIGVLIAFTALIPIVGAFIGCVVGAFLILVDSPMKALIFIVIFLVLQQIEGNLIYPHVVGSSVGLPSIWVLLAVTVGGSMMGIVGMLIFIPLMSTCYTLLKEDVNLRNTKKVQASRSNVPQKAKKEK